MLENISKKFNQCPACGSKKRFFETLCRELIDRNLAPHDFTYSFQLLGGNVTCPQKEAGYPIGTEVPGFQLRTDVCLDCGCVYAVQLEARPVKKQLPPARIITPNKTPMPPFMNNPRMS